MKGITQLTSTLGKILKRVSWVVLLVFTIFNQSIAAEKPIKLKVGVVPQYPEQELRFIWEPILVSVAKRTGIQFVFVSSNSIPDFEIKLFRGEFDLAFMNPFHLLVANELESYQPILRDIGRHLRGIIVVRKDSGITHVSQLVDKAVSFPAPNSLGASLMTQAALANIYKISVKPKYVNTHSATYRSVLFGESIAGGGVMKTFDRQPSEVKETLRIIYKTKKVSTHPIAIHTRVDADLIERITNAFLELSETPEGNAIISRIPMKKMGRAHITDYDELKQMELGKVHTK